jgi:hypothetical protein
LDGLLVLVGVVGLAAADPLSTALVPEAMSLDPMAVARLVSSNPMVTPAAPWASDLNDTVRVGFNSGRAEGGPLR